MRFSDLSESRVTVGMRDKLKKALAQIDDEAVREHIGAWIDTAFADAMNIPTYGGYGFEQQYALPLALAIHAVTDEHMKEFLTDWTYQVFGGDKGMPYSRKTWETVCSTGTLPKAKVSRPRPFKKFEELYLPIAHNGMYQRERDQIPQGTPDNLIWTVNAPESGRGPDVLTAGESHHGYSWIVCRRPFPPSEYSSLGYYF